MKTKDNLLPVGIALISAEVQHLKVSRRYYKRQLQGGIDEPMLDGFLAAFDTMIEDTQVVLKHLQHLAKNGETTVGNKRVKLVHGSLRGSGDGER